MNRAVVKECQIPPDTAADSETVLSRRGDSIFDHAGRADAVTALLDILGRQSFTTYDPNSGPCTCRRCEEERRRIDIRHRRKATYLCPVSPKERSKVEVVGVGEFTGPVGVSGRQTMKKRVGRLPRSIAAKA